MTWVSVAVIQATRTSGLARTRTRKNQYSLKHLHKLMVNSRAYRQSSKPNPNNLDKDSDNKFLWRKSPSRLEAESLRDSMLKVSGKLNNKMGGPGFRDVTFRSLNGTTYYTPFDKEDPELNRRTVYRFSPRDKKRYTRRL